MVRSLLDARPDIAAQWHPLKNGAVTPGEVTAGSSKKFWWQCQAMDTHAWEAAPATRCKLGPSCPFCSGQRTSPEASLGALNPELAAQWHPTENGSLTPFQVRPGSSRHVRWTCPKNHEHVWDARVCRRTQGSGCPLCANRRVSEANSLAVLQPELAAQWHPTRNGSLSPADVTTGTARKVWWLCPAQPDHEWLQRVEYRVRAPACPACSGKLVVRSTSLAATHPEVAAEWHPSKNPGLSPQGEHPGTAKRVWWRCSRGHEWPAKISARTRIGTGCPSCKGKQATPDHSLAAVVPALAATWHPTRNGDLTPDRVTPSSGRIVWWLCDRQHPWEAAINNRRRQGCPYCAGKRASSDYSLQVADPRVAEQWHQDKNGPLTPADVTPGSGQLIWWQCPDFLDHGWPAQVVTRVKGGSGCPLCANQRVSDQNSLAARFPALANEWHPTKNGDLTPATAVAGSNRKAWWQCPSSADHVWLAAIAKRTSSGQGCPLCNQGWTLSRIRLMVQSLLPHLQTLTPAELYAICSQNGVLNSGGKGRSFVQALVTGRFPREQLEEFAEGRPSAVDRLVDGSVETVDDLLPGSQSENQDQPSSAGLQAALPELSVTQALASLDGLTTVIADGEALDFLLASARDKLWKCAFADERPSVEGAQRFAGGTYAKQAAMDFLDEYRSVKALPVPEAYAFTVLGRSRDPNLMQRLVAHRVQTQKRVGNWSGTGAGKTLSAILGGRISEARMTVVCCPNSVVSGWKREILHVFPDSDVVTKTFTPVWSDGHSWKYLILNYEMLQHPRAEGELRSLLADAGVDFIIVDEIHHAKQRQAEDMSMRRRMVQSFISHSAVLNPSVRVLAMSATPVVNNLQEGKSMVELVTGLEHQDLETRPTVANCMALHQKLVTLGIRWMPDYQSKYSLVVDEIQVDCSERLADIRQLGAKDILGLEQILTEVRLPVILRELKRKTLIYTHYVGDIDRLLYDAVRRAGWSVGFYTGEDKSGLDAFVRGDLDVLIGSSSVGTGVDGLQQVCDQLIINVLPWTNADFEQLLGRIYRQGQKSQAVRVVIPITYADHGGDRWSWCDQKMNRLRFKKSIADAAVDGIVPERHLRTPGQAYQDVMAWLSRLDGGDIREISRRRIESLLAEATDAGKSTRRSYSTFSGVNHRWNTSKSSATHERLRRDPREWAQYHADYRDARADWALIPYEDFIAWAERRSSYAIADFGCGEARIAEAVSDRHTVHSFDHVAATEHVIACDIAHVPLEDDSIDVAVFSLSLMGSNFTDYLREAWRTLRLDGHLHIYEATSRFADRQAFARNLAALGFEVVRVADRWKFTYIYALKTDRRPDPSIELTFGKPLEHRGTS